MSDFRFCNSVRTKLFFTLSVFLMVWFFSFTQANANNQEKNFPHFKKCDLLKAKSKKNKNKDAYVIWDAQSDLLFACSRSELKTKKLNKVLKTLYDKNLKKFLKFRHDQHISDHNSIPQTVIKVKKGQNLASLYSKAYDSPYDPNKIIGSNIDSENNVFEDGYVFFPTPDKKLDRDCIIRLVPDGYVSIPTQDNNVKKNCIFKTLPVHFSLVPVKEIKYPTFSISIDKPSVKESGVLKFNVSKQGEQSLIDLPASVSYEILPGTASKDDYKFPSQVNPIVFNSNERTKIITIPTLADANYEVDETLSVQLSKPIHSSIKNAKAVGTIIDSTKATVDIVDEKIHVNEGETVKFKIKRVDDSNLPFSISYELIADTADGDDFKQASGKIEFTANVSEKPLSVETFRDKLEEGPEQFRLRLSSTPDIKLKRSESFGTIKNVEVCWDKSEVEKQADCPVKPPKLVTCWDDSTVIPPANCPILPSSGLFSVSDAKANEGDPLEFIISRNEPYDLPVTINYETIERTAKAGENYEAKSNQVKFAGGDDKKSIKVSTKPTNSLAEKSLKLRIFSESKIQFSNNTAIGTIKPKQTCDNDRDELRENSTNKPNVKFIKRLDGYERIFETEGTAQPCEFVYVSVNQTYLKDIETGSYVYTQADEDGKYSLKFAAGSIAGVTERTIALNEVKRWELKNPGMTLPVGRHFSVNSSAAAEILDVHSSQKSPEDVSNEDLKKSGKYLFVSIPGGEECGFIYRYNPNNLKKETGIQYTIRGEKNNGSCHIRARGTSSKPLEKHVLYAAKNEMVASRNFNVNDNGEFDVLIPFPDTQNFYIVSIIRSVAEYYSSSINPPDLTSEDKVGEIVFAPANGKAGIDEAVELTMKSFFKDLLIQLEKAQTEENNKLKPKITENKKYTAERNFKISSEQVQKAIDATKGPDGVSNLTALQDQSIEKFGYTLKIYPNSSEEKEVKWSRSSGSDNWTLENADDVFAIGDVLFEYKPASKDLQTFTARILQTKGHTSTTPLTSKKIEIELAVKSRNYWDIFIDILKFLGLLFAALSPIMGILFWIFNRKSVKNKILRKLKLDNSISTPKSDQKNLKLGLQKFIRNSGVQDVEVFASKIRNAGRKTCLISSGDRHFGTGFLVDDDKILTNYHVLQEVERSGLPLSQIKAIFDYAKNENNLGVSAGTSFDFDLDFEPVISLVSSGDRFDEEPMKLDYAYLKLMENIGGDSEPNPRGSFNMRLGEARLSDEQDVLVFHHPSADPVKFSFGQFQSYEDEDVRSRVRYDATTLYGSSGGAVLNANFELIALHHAGDSHKPPQFNQGIPIHLIKKDIDRQLAARENV